MSKAASGDWYKRLGQAWGPTLNTAAAMDAYTLTDRATWSKFANKQNLTVLVEGDKKLFNQYGVILVNPAQIPQREGRRRPGLHRLADLARGPDRHRQLQDRRRPGLLPGSRPAGIVGIEIRERGFGENPRLSACGPQASLSQSSWSAKADHPRVCLPLSGFARDSRGLIKLRITRFATAKLGR